MIKNMTPHPIMLLDEENEVVGRFESTGLIRLSARTERAEDIDGIATSRTVFGNPEGLPKFKAGTFIIVSQLVRSALPERADLLVPAEVVRDKAGNIIGCRSLGR
jgi:hypothetical protein